MRMRISLFAAARIASVLLLLQGAAAEAAEIKVLAGAFYKPVLEELGAKFERATGHTLAVKWVPGPAVRREVEDGEAFDVAISQSDTMDHLIRTGKIDPATRANLVRIGLGMAIRAGAPKPDISSVEGFKRALLEAKSVATSPQSVSATYLASLLDRWGIAVEVKPKIRIPGINTGGAFGAVARGDAEIGIAASAIIPGTDLVPLPAELQVYQVFVVGVGTGARETEGGRALVKFLTSESAVPVIRAKGMEPGK